MPPPGNVISDTVSLYKHSTRIAWQWFIRNPTLIAGALGAYLSLILFGIIATPLSSIAIFGMLLGVLYTVLQGVLLTFFYGWVATIASHGKITWRELSRFDLNLFINFVSVSFIFSLARWAIGSMQGIDTPAAVTLLNLAIVFAFNPVPEVIAIGGNSSMAALVHALEFTRDNIVRWFLPIVLLLIPLLVIDLQLPLTRFQSSLPLFPGLLASRVVEDLIAYSLPGIQLLGMLLGIVAAVWFTLFRVALFEKLEARR